MTRIQLQISLNPTTVEAFMKIKRKDESYRWLTAVVDTGASVCLLPNYLLDDVEHRLSERETVTLDQAGIAKQAFTATEAYVKVSLEDLNGSRTDEFEIQVWFADTDQILIGFNGILDRAVLHVDMPNRTGYLEFT